MSVGNNNKALGWLCAAVLCWCCSVRPSEACPFLQRKIAERQQQQQQLSNEATTVLLAEEEDFDFDQEDNLEVSEGHRKLQRRFRRFPCRRRFCYGSLTELPPLELGWEDLVAIAAPSGGGVISYMEDARAREDQLGGFPLNNGAVVAAAGYTYLGQLLSHDMNQDTTSTLGVSIDPFTIRNGNNPSVDLDTIYSIGRCSPNIVDDKFIVNDRDYERDGSGVAQICDSRNDDHRILSQITVAWMTLHNKFVDDLGLTFEEARDATIREWQAVVLSDMLPNLLDADTLSAVAGGDRLLYIGDVYDEKIMPADFSTAAYRLMHSRARTNYRLNSNEIPVVFFDVGDDEPNLLGGSPLPADLVIEWERFFGDPTQGPRIVEVARILDMLYVQPLISIPFDEAGAPSGPNIVVECADDTCPITVTEPEVNGVVKANLALLDLVRGQTHSLPGGIAYAEYVAALDPSMTVLTVEDMASNAFGLPAEITDNNSTDVPLLLYLAHESIAEHNGEVLGKLGSRIVSEVVYGNVETATPTILDGGSFVSLITGSSAVTMREVFDHIGWA